MFEPNNYKIRLKKNSQQKLDEIFFDYLNLNYNLKLFFLKYNYFVDLSFSMLSVRYVYLGYNVASVTLLMKNFLIGNYFNISIINLYYVVNFLKKNFLFLFRVILNKFINILVISENLRLFNTFEKKFKYLDIDYFFGLWWAGFLLNLKLIDFHKVFYSKKYFLKFRRLPGFIFFIGFADITTPYSLNSAFNEFKKLDLLNLLVIDTNMSIRILEN